jgi:hypothetical protein
MDSAGIIPEEDLQETAKEEPAQAEEIEGGSERLSVFEDFLENLNLEDNEDESDEEQD